VIPETFSRFYFRTFGVKIVLISSRARELLQFLASNTIL
jgi:hypothetical protein